MSKETGKAGMAAEGEIVRGAKQTEYAKAKNFYEVECVRDGKVIWVERFGNLVVDEGLDSLLDRFKTSSTTWFVGLADGTPTPAAGDTMASHAGWAEVTSYDEATRESLVLGTVSGQSVDNSGEVASFAINGTVTAGGAFVTSDGAKSGGTGTLYSIGAFGSDKSLDAGDTLNITVTLTTAAA